MKRSDLTEIDGVAWCLGHDVVWYGDELWCRNWAMPGVCLEAPLFRGPAITGRIAAGETL